MDEWMVELEGVECPIQRETTLEELAERCQPDFQAPIVLAVVNNKLAELTRRITNGDKIHFVTTAETPGSEAYERSLLMLLNMKGGIPQDVVRSKCFRDVVAC